MRGNANHTFVGTRIRMFRSGLWLDTVRCSAHAAPELGKAVRNPLNPVAGIQKVTANAGLVQLFRPAIYSDQRSKDLPELLK